MSYQCTISFKTLTEAEIYSFQQAFKQKVIACLDKIADSERYFLPTNRYPSYQNLPEHIQESLDAAWIRQVFTHRYFYLPEHHLFGMFGVPDEVKDLFDCTVYFQNSCDQDYDYEEWKGIPIFEKLAEKWKTCSDETIMKLFFEKDWLSEECDDDKLEYYRKTALYKEIWGMCEQFLWNDTETVCISLFSHSELSVLYQFIALCKNKEKQH